MPKYVIERRIPKAGQLTAVQLQAISQKSNGVLEEMGPQLHWLQSYVTDDAILCTYIAPDEESVREHARRGGFPADRVMKVSTIIDPSTAEV
jgi:cell division inhibitor SulA